MVLPPCSYCRQTKAPPAAAVLLNACATIPAAERSHGAMPEYANFYFCPAGNEQIKTVIHIGPSCRSALRGVVLDASEAPVRDALVLLMKAGEGDGDDSVLACCFTQPDGGFAFGPLPGNALYIVRVFKSSARLRNVEITLE